MISLRAVKRAPLGSPRSECHSIGDHRLRQKYSRIYGALSTCPEGTVFAAVFIRINTCNILRVYTGYVHTFPLNPNPGQGRHPLMFSQCAPCTGGTPMFGSPPPLCFTNQLQNWQAPESRHPRQSHCAFVMEGKHNLCLVGCCSLLA